MVKKKKTVTAEPIDTTTTFDSSTAASTTPNNAINPDFNNQMTTKTALGHSKLLVKRLEPLFSRIVKIITEEETLFELVNFKTESSSLLKQFEESATYLIHHSTNDFQPEEFMSTQIGIEDKVNKLVSEHRRLFKRNSIVTYTTPPAIKIHILSNCFQCPHRNER